MCNPRRIRVRATRTISEQWHAEIVRTAQASGTATGEARLTQPLATMLSPAALRGFEQAVGSDPDWQWVDGEYRYQVPGGYAAYRDGELEIVVQLSADLQVEGRGSRVVSGEVRDEVHADVDQQYYGDGYGGLNRRWAERVGQEEADRQVELRARQRREFLAAQARDRERDALHREAGDVEREARADAERNLAEQRERVGTELSQQAEARLDGIRDETLRGVFRTVAVGYQNALLAYAQQHGAERISVADNDGVIEIEFEMEA